MTDFDFVAAKLLVEFPKFKIVSKRDSWLMRVISGFLWAITFGLIHDFMTRFITTIGYTVYVPGDWSTWSQAQRAIVLRHERVHMQQRAKYGMVLFTLMYVFLPFPCIFSYYRMKFEMEAYAETIKATCELYVTGIGLVQTPEVKANMVGHFTKAEYFWMWPFKKRVEAWYDETVRKVISECRRGPRY